MTRVYSIPHGLVLLTVVVFVFVVVVAGVGISGGVSFPVTPYTATFSIIYYSHFHFISCIVYCGCCSMR